MFANRFEERDLRWHNEF